jgi:hypothetical protein
MNDLDFPETCRIYPTTVDAYGKDVLGEPATVPCMYGQTTGYQHGSSQDAIVGTPWLALPGDDSFVQDHAFRLEEMIVEINPFGGSATSQRFKITSVTPARDVLLNNELKHVECELKKIETQADVS